MRSIVAVFVLLLSAAAAWSQDALSDADKAFRAADFKEAARLYAAAADGEADAGRRADIRIKLAVTYFNIRNRAKAEESIVAALKDAPQLELVSDFYTSDFLALFSRVKSKLATPAAASAAVRTPPPGSLAQVRQRLAQATDNASVEALLPAIQALEGSVPATQVVDVLDVKGDTLERLGRTGEALELRGRVSAMRATAQTAPGTVPVPLEALLDARRLIAAGRPLDSISLLRGVLAAAPSCFPAFEVLAEAYLAAGKLDDASNALRTALLGSQKPELFLLLGEVELKRNNMTAARDAFRRAAELEPGNDRALAALGLLAARIGDMTSARETLDKALAANGLLFEARVARAQISLLDGRTSEAIANFQRALQTKPDDPWASGWLGAAYLTSGNAAGAADKLALAVKGGEIEFALALAEAQRRTGKVDEALATLDTVKADSTLAGLLRGRCLLDAHKPAEAQEVLQNLVATDTESAEARYLLGFALHAQHQWGPASQELARAAAMRNATKLMKEGAGLGEATRLAQAVLDSAVTPPPPPAHR